MTPLPMHWSYIFLTLTHRYWLYKKGWSCWPTHNKADVAGLDVVVGVSIQTLSFQPGIEHQQRPWGWGYRGQHKKKNSTQYILNFIKDT